jgi:hypothetical protein
MFSMVIHSMRVVALTVEWVVGRQTLPSAPDQINLRKP